MQEIQETQVQSLGWEDSLEEGMATHSSILAWSSMGSQEQLSTRYQQSELICVDEGPLSG